MLDSQASVHLIRERGLLDFTFTSPRPITIQGITRDKTRVTEEGNLKSLGIRAYYCPNIAANIISYSRLTQTHHCNYDTTTDTFNVTPKVMGPTLSFTNVKGHYTLNVDTVLSAFSPFSESQIAHLTKREREGALRAYEFIIKMGFVSYQKAAEAVQRGSIEGLGFTRGDLVHAQRTYGYPAAFQLGHGTQKAKTAGSINLLSIQECEAQEL